MTSYADFFRGKRITLMGLGLLGRGIGDAAFLASLGAKLLITDRKPKEALEPSLAQLAAFPNIAYRLGEHREEDFTGTDMVIKAAGVPLDSPYIAAAQAAGVPVYMSTALFAKFAMEAGAKIVGVTGTRGKTTTTCLIHEALAALGKRTHLGGNIRGVSTLALLPEVQTDDVAVLELDSWQLQGFGTLRISPNVAVFTNLMPDHLNYYPDMGTYFQDKANIFRNQRPGDWLVAGHAIVERILATHPPVAATVPTPLPSDWTLQIPGEHNRENAALAAEALRAFGCVDAEIRPRLESFTGVEGRLQRIATIGDVDVYNDNNATTPQATIAALRAFPGRNIVLVAGGAAKGIDVSDFARTISETCGYTALLAGTGTDMLHPLLPDVPIFDALAPAVDAAFAHASPGDVLLFSPGFASFGLFKNEYDRNDQFLALVETRK